LELGFWDFSFVFATESAINSSAFGDYCHRLAAASRSTFGCDLQACQHI
jgi:hypothetical protein